MRTDTLRRTVGAVATSSIAVHLVSSILQNTPDSFNQDLRKFVGGWPLPGWRFFAPNPGVQNVHLLVRTTAPGAAEPTPWRDMTPTIEHGVLQVVWNPNSRGPKALFDAMQQLSVMSSNYVQFDWVVQSEPYDLVASAARASSEEGSAAVQFLLMNYVPSAEEDQQMVPVVVSEWLETSPTGTSPR